MSNDTVGYRLNLDSLEEFYRRCMARNAKTKEERIAILKELCQELQALKMTKQDLSRALKSSKHVLHIRHKETPNNDNA